MSPANERRVRLEPDCRHVVTVGPLGQGLLQFGELEALPKVVEHALREVVLDAQLAQTGAEFLPIEGSDAPFTVVGPRTGAIEPHIPFGGNVPAAEGDRGDMAFANCTGAHHNLLIPVRRQFPECDHRRIGQCGGLEGVLQGEGHPEQQEPRSIETRARVDAHIACQSAIGYPG